MTAPTPVNPVQAAKGGVDLLSSAVLPRDGERWELGLSWRPERCITFQGFSPCGDVVGRPVDPDSGAEYYIPPSYRVRDLCSTISGPRDEERVRRQADAILSHVAALELWTGALSVANPATVNGAPHVNPHLASNAATTVVGTGTLAERFGQLEQAARVAALGQQVFIHVPIHLVTPLGALILRKGTALYTQLDSVIVADSGYPGTGPGGTGTEWIYATGPVQVRFSDVQVLADMAETMDRRTNRQEIWAERTFAATFDPCLHLAMNTAA